MGGRTWRKWRSRHNKPKKEEIQRKAEAMEWALMRRVDAHLLQGIWAAPADTHLRLVYSDWLEEHGQSWQASLVRLESQIEALPPEDPQRSQLEDERATLLNDYAEVADEDADKLVPTWLDLWRHIRTLCPRCGGVIPPTMGNFVEYCDHCGVSFLGNRQNG